MRRLSLVLFVLAAPLLALAAPPGDDGFPVARGKSGAKTTAKSAAAIEAEVNRQRAKLLELEQQLDDALEADLAAATTAAERAARVKELRRAQQATAELAVKITARAYALNKELFVLGEVPADVFPAFSIAGGNIRPGVVGRLKADAAVKYQVDDDTYVVALTVVHNTTAQTIDAMVVGAVPPRSTPGALASLSGVYEVTGMKLAGVASVPVLKSVTYVRPAKRK